MQNEKIKGSDLVAEILENLEITHAFGIIGAGNVHLFQSIADRGYTKIICVHHEQSATMAMQTYFRTTGKLAACLVTTGAGSTNAVTGVVSAWADSIPGLVIAGNENSTHCLPNNDKRMWGVQGYDSVHMVSKVTKYSHRILSAKNIAYELKKCKKIALDARPGPVWLEIPMDLQSEYISRNDIASYQYNKISDYQNEFTIDNFTERLKLQFESVKDSIQTAKRPVLWLGHGIRLSGAHDRLEELLDRLQIPAIVSWAGIDMLDSDHPLVYGRAGVYGQRCANFVLQNSDYVLAIGTRLAIPQIGYNLNELARDAVIDVVDIDATEATKHRNRTRENIICDAKIFIEYLLEDCKTELRTNWIEQCNKYRNEFPWIDIDLDHPDQDGFINSYPFMTQLNRYFREDEIIVTDMGTALLCGHQVLKLKPGQRLMTSTGLGEMGFGLPAAIGASIALDNKSVICLNCDGGMMLNLQELQTIVHHELPIKIFVFNNDGYLMIKHTQNNLFDKSTVAVDKKSGVSCPDFSKLARAFDIPCYQIRSWSECEPVLKNVMSEKGPVVCEVFMHPMQKFNPKLKPHLTADGKIVSPPLEDLSPLLPRNTIEKAMIIGMHEKSRGPLCE